MANKVYPSVRSVLREAVEYYLDEPPTMLQIVADPVVRGTYAVRTQGKGPVVDLLVTGLQLDDAVPDIAAQFEEVDYGTWPPQFKQ